MNENNAPRFIRIDTEGSSIIINLNDVTAAEHISTVSLTSGEPTGQFCLRLHMVSGKEFTLYGKASDALWLLINAASINITPQTEEVPA